MTEEYDEEVVFENSPLFQYLQDLGHTDFEACPTVSPEEEPRAEGEERPFPQDAPCLSRDGAFWKLAEALWRCSSLHQGGVTERQQQQLDGEFRQYSLRTILEQDVLLQEDVELIELLDPSILSAGSSSDPAPTAAAPPAPSFLATPSLWDLSVLLAFVAVLAALRSLEGGPGLWLLVPWALGLGGFVALRGVGLWQEARLQRTMRRHGRQLEQLAQESRALTGLARKCLRLLQETEVISRGFTLVSAACSFSRAGQPRSQQLQGLRRASYRTLRSAFRASRLATCHMLKSYPLDSEVDNVTNYVSTVPLKELGLGLGEERLTDEQVQDLTDDYSLPALKVLFQLWVGQSSEFFRRLALLLSLGRAGPRGAGPADGEDQGEGQKSRPAHLVVAEVTGPLHRALSGCLGNLQRSYDFHRYFETQKQSQGSERARAARQKCRELNSLHTSVRSLQLHLKALLNEMIILEDELEKLMVARETTEVTDSGYQDLQDRLRLLQPHMQASSSCWDETVAQVDRMLHRAGDRPDSLAGTPETPEQNAGPLLPPPPPTVTLIQDRDPIPEEQELEAYVSDSDSDEEWRGPLLDLLSPEERERQRREREESRRVLLELKSVLGMRASEMERQKWKQLLFSDGAAVTRALPTEPTEPPRTSDPPDPERGANHHAPDRPDRPDPPPPQTEFSCGEAPAEQEPPRHAPVSDGKAETLHYQYDGSEGAEPGAETNGTDWPFVAKVPAVSVMDRLTELHGSATLSFSSALAAQVAARSHSFSNMEEQTFGDEDGDEGREEEGEGFEEEVMSQPWTPRQTEQD